MSFAKKKSKEVVEKGSLTPTNSSYQLSKTKYCTGIQCLKALYLSIHRNDLATPPDEGQQQRFDYGRLVGAEAQKHYAKGMLIEADHFHRSEAVEKTRQAIQQETTAIFEAAFFWERTLVRVDILRNNQDGTWDIIEVKSSTSVKDEHIPDMAIQRFVVEKCGVKVRSSILKHINKECVYPHLENLFTDADCSDRVKEEMKLAPDYLNKMFSALDKPEVPNDKIGPQCSEPYECAFKAHCWKDVPKYSVFELTGVWAKTKFELYNRGCTKIADIPDEEKVSRSKPEQIQSVKNGAPLVDRRGIKEWVENLEYPIYFLDFETINPPIPLFNGTRPYQQVPFQFSCHVQKNKGGPLEQIEFLAESSADPRQELTKKLCETLGTGGSIVAYNAKFEKSVIEDLLDTFSEYSTQLRRTLERFVDLLEIFKKHYFHPDFHGSNSIKATLPVLVPNMNYDELDVYNGSVAQIQYERMISDDTPQILKAEIRKNLLQYCSQDSLAMAKLLEYFIRL